MDLFNFDLDQVEEALKDEKLHNNKKSKKQQMQEGDQSSQNYNEQDNDDENNKRKKRRDRSRSRSHSKKHRRKKHSNSRSQSKSKNKDKKRYSEERQNKTQRNNNVDDQYPDREGECEDQKRDDLTVLVLQLPLKAVEKDIYKFFLQGTCGKIRDIRLIRDPKYGKSKGVAYIEFYDQESVFKAVQLNGTKMMNHFLLIQPSFAEKNRVHQSVKGYKLSKDSESNKANKIYISGLTDQLADIQEENLQEIFLPFGEIEFIDLRRDPKTQKSLGFALIQYKNPKDAKAALESMDGFKINGKAISVSDKPTQLQFNIIQESQASAVPQQQQQQMQQPSQSQQQKDLDYEEGSSFLHSSQSRYLLMQKLTRSEQPTKESASEEQIQRQQEQNFFQQPTVTLQQYDNQSTIIPPSATAGSITAIGGKKIIPEANVYIKNLDPSVSTNQLESVFSMYGPILSCKIAADAMGNSLGYAYVQYENKESADMAIKTASGTKLKGTIITVQPFISKINRIDARNNLYVKNLPNNLPEDELRAKIDDIFGRFGRISSSVVKFDSTIGRPFAFICYEDHDAAQLSHQGLNGQDPFQTGMGLYISWAEKKPERVQRLTDMYSSSLINSVLGAGGAMGGIGVPPGMQANMMNPLAMQGLAGMNLLNMSQFTK